MAARSGRDPGYPTAVLMLLATHPGTFLLYAAAFAAVFHFGLTGFAVLLCIRLGRIALRWVGRSGPPPGKVLAPGDQPGITTLVRAVAEAVGFAEPILVCLIPFPDAALSECRLDGARVLCLEIGLPFLRGLTQAELAAIIAHELGHRRHLSDARVRRLLGARAALAEAVGHGAKLPRMVGSVLLRRTQQLSFDRELESDAAAARLVGGQVVRSALEKTDLQASVFEGLVARWFVKLEEAGRYPADVYEAFDQALHDPRVRASATEAVPIDSWESHPLTALRVSALPPSTGSNFPDEPVSLRDSDDLEKWCVAALSGDDLSPVRILDDPSQVLVSGKDAVLALQELGTTPSLIMTEVLEGSWRRSLPRDPDSQQMLRGILVAALADALVRQGWRRRSPWLNRFLCDPEGLEIDLRDVLQAALDDPARAEPARELAYAAGLTG